MRVCRLTGRRSMVARQLIQIGVDAGHFGGIRPNGSRVLIAVVELLTADAVVGRITAGHRR